jgi:N-acetylneuraminic acid mutarotase
MKAKTLLIWLTGFSTLTLAITSCTKNSNTTSTEGNWIRRSSFEGRARSLAASFSIGNIGYVTTGYDGNPQRLKDLWQYNPDLNFWQQKAQFAGIGRQSAVGFTIGNKGYVGTGSDGYNYLSDFWEYNPESNVWTRKADLPIIDSSLPASQQGRYGAVGFGINGKGYITTGFNGSNALKDCWEFDPAAGDAGTWSVRASMTGDKRYNAVAFVYNNKAYVTTGTYSGGTLNDLNVFNPSLPDGQAWSQKRRISNATDSSFDDNYNIVRSNAVAFIMNDKAYITTGQNGSVLKTTWEYDFNADEWKEKTAFEGSARLGACAFSLNNRGFILLGTTSSLSSTALEDIFEFHPNEEYNSDPDQ